MKKRITGIPAMLLLVTMLFASQPTRNKADRQHSESLISRSVALTCTIDRLAQSYEYMKLFIGASAELDEYVAKIGAGNYTLQNKAIHTYARRGTDFSRKIS